MCVSALFRWALSDFYGIVVLENKGMGNPEGAKKWKRKPKKSQK